MSQIFFNFLNKHISVKEEEIKNLLHYTTRRSIKKREVLFKEGNYCNEMAFVEKGLFRATANVNDEIETIQFYAEESFAVDFSNFMSGTPYSHSIVAIEESEVLLLGRDLLLSLLNSKNPKWALFAAKISEIKITEQCQRQKTLLHNSPEERYDLFINNYPNLYNRLSLNQVASYLGIRPESLSRIRSRKARIN